MPKRAKHPWQASPAAGDILGPLLSPGTRPALLCLCQVVNHLAAQTLILNQDRCTKNFYLYLDLTSQQWSMLPWVRAPAGPPGREGRDGAERGGPALLVNS